MKVLGKFNLLGQIHQAIVRGENWGGVAESKGLVRFGRRIENCKIEKRQNHG